MKCSRRRIVVLQILIFVSIFLLWEFLVRFRIVSDLALAPPSEVFPAIVRHYGLFFEHFLVTMKEIVLGFSCAMAISLFLALLIVHSDLLARILYPYIIGLNSTAKVAIAPLILLVFGHGLRPVVAIVALISFLPMTINLIVGLKSADADLLDLMKIHRASQWQILSKVRFPSALPYIFSGLKISAVLAVKGAVIGEIFQSSDRGLGFLIMQGDLYFNVAMVYAAAIIVCSIGTFFFMIIGLLEKRMLRWHESGSGFWK